MKAYLRAREILVALRDEANREGDLLPIHTEAYAASRRQAWALHEAITVFDLGEALAAPAGYSPAKKDRLVNYFKRETMK